MQEESHPDGSMSLKWVALFFAVLALFFVYFPFFPSSLYSSVFSLSGLYDSRLAYETSRNVIHVFVLASGILVLIAFLSLSLSGKRRFRVEELVAVNCALESFLLQAAVSLGIQRFLLDWYRPTQGEPRVNVDLVQVTYFVASVLLLVVAYMLLTRRRRGRAFVLNVLAYSLIGHVVYVAAAMIYMVGMPVLDSYLDIAFVLLLTTGFSVYYLQKPVYSPKEPGEKSTTDASEEIKVAETGIEQPLPRRLLSLRWPVVAFALLTLVFLFVPGLWGSSYSGVLSLFGVYDVGAVYLAAFNAVYFFSLASAIFLILLFARSSEPRARVEELAAVYCALQAFVVQASVSLAFQYSELSWHTPVGGGGFVVVIFLWIALFVATLLLLVAAYGFLVGHGLIRAVAGHILWFAFAGNIIGVWLSVYFWYDIPMFGNFPGVNLLMALVSAMAIYYLWKSRTQAG